jgi:hypothetical protein
MSNHRTNLVIGYVNDDQHIDLASAINSICIQVTISI